MYELLYIVPVRYTDAEVADIQKNVAGLITQAGGTIVKEENLGKVRLAYPIKGVRHGSYVLVYFEAESDRLKPLEDQLRLHSEILRHMMLTASAGDEKRKWELQSYVAPLSEEEAETRAATRPTRPTVIHAPIVAAPPAPPMIQGKPMSIEDLDKKLDEILDAGDITENI